MALRKTRVVSWKFLPARLPLVATGVGWLLLDRFGAPSWAYGVFWTVAALFFIAAIVSLFFQTPSTPVFDEDTPSLKDFGVRTKHG